MFEATQLSINFLTPSRLHHNVFALFPARAAAGFADHGRPLDRSESQNTSSPLLGCEPFGGITIGFCGTISAYLAVAARSLEGHSGSWLYFFIALPILWMPWSFLGLKALSNFHHLWQQPFLKFAWSWFGFVFIFFSLANTKLPHYLLYAAPAVCVLLTVTALNASKLLWVLTALLGILFLTILLYLPNFLQTNIELLKNDFYISLFQHAVETHMWKWMFLAPVCVFALLALNNYFIKRNFLSNQDQYFLGFAAFAVFQSCVLALVALPWWSHTLQSPVYELAKSIQHRPEQLVQWGVHFPSISTYRGHETPKREPLPGELALVKNLKPNWPSGSVVVETRGPLSVIQLPPKKGSIP